MALASLPRSGQHPIDKGLQRLVQIGPLMNYLEKLDSDRSLVQDGLMEAGGGTCRENPAEAVQSLRGFAEAELNRREIDRTSDHDIAVARSFGLTLDRLQDQRGLVETRLFLQQMCPGQFVGPLDFRPGAGPRRRVQSRQALQAVDACSAFMRAAIVTI